MNVRPRTSPMTGATTMKIRVLYQPSAIITCDPDHSSADRLGDGGSEKKRGHKIEERCPQYRQLWGQDPRRDHGGDAVGGIVKSVQKIEDQCDQYCDDQQKQIRLHKFSYFWGRLLGLHVFFNTTVSSTFATSSALSVARSRNSSNSLIFMRLMASRSRSNSPAMAC